MLYRVWGGSIWLLFLKSNYKRRKIIIFPPTDLDDAIEILENNLLNSLNEADIPSIMHSPRTYKM